MVPSFFMQLFIIYGVTQNANIIYKDADPRIKICYNNATNFRCACSSVDRALVSGPDFTVSLNLLKTK
jgi:hypothetical protein